ncbi:hypothetical protein FHS18_005712 [Paenibacillus phyllosphaerae]|uniref:Uncharacterized protein n=1 Tax=Paenibacillus phyllosphaerae TaxID=274593 RepID=A0A7W5B388_9BACL|nr:hypothetical protein [Paenibacillus phyllosphaerae]MBB3113599.1 hypothetical protein [Paenibacillus phyllosphaerae]
MAEEPNKGKRTLQEREAIIAEAAKRNGEAQPDAAVIHKIDELAEGMAPHWQSFYRSIRDAVAGIRD